MAYIGGKLKCKTTVENTFNSLTKDIEDCVCLKSIHTLPNMSYLSFILMIDNQKPEIIT